MTTARRRLQPKWKSLLWGAGMVIAMIIGLLYLGTLEDAEGDPIVKNPEQLIVQLLATAGLVASVVLPLLIKTQKDAAEAKEQVSNDHVKPDGTPINMRVENDERHVETLTVFREAVAELTAHFNRRFDAVGSEIRGVRSDVRRTQGRIDKTTDKLDKHIEKSGEVIETFTEEIDLLKKQLESPREG